MTTNSAAATAANASPSSSSNYSSGFGGGLSGSDQQNSRSNSPSSFSNASSSSQSFFGQFKQEPANSLDNNNVLIKSEVMATFSSDDDDEDEYKETNANVKLSMQLQQQIQTNTNSLMPPSTTTTSSTTKSPSPSASFLQLQGQLNQFLNSGDMRRPFKLFTSVDDVTTNEANSLDNHIHLIASDYLRDKLFELNDKIKTTKAVSSHHHQQINAAFKDILTYIHRDVDTLNNFSSTLTDLTISLCIILKNDFTNCLLPSSFYANVVKNNNNQQKSSQQQQQQHQQQHSQGLSKEILIKNVPEG